MAVVGVARLRKCGVVAGCTRCATLPAEVDVHICLALSLASRRAAVVRAAHSMLPQEGCVGAAGATNAGAG